VDALVADFVPHVGPEAEVDAEGDEGDDAARGRKDRHERCGEAVGEAADATDDGEASETGCDRVEDEEACKDVEVRPGEGRRVWYDADGEAISDTFTAARVGERAEMYLANKRVDFEERDVIHLRRNGRDGNNDEHDACRK